MSWNTFQQSKKQRTTDVQYDLDKISRKYFWIEQAAKLQGLYFTAWLYLYGIL